jgi:insertion element IS1 protein InsB
VAISGVKKNRLWVIKALDRGTRRTVARVLGNRDAATFRRLYGKVRHLGRRVFRTDAWGAFAEVLPCGWHVVGKAHAAAVERDNGDARRHLARFTRRTKAASRSRRVVDPVLRIWHAVSTTDLFARPQEVALSIHYTKLQSSRFT